VNGQHYKIRYNVLARAPDKATKDFKDVKDFKAPAFPAPFEFGGSYCICLSKPEGDLNAHLKSVQDYYQGLFSKLPGYAPSLADHFRVGDNWEVQQTAYTVFMEAFKATKEELELADLKRDLEPYDEIEAIVDLLQGVADRDILPGILAGIQGPDQVRFRLENAARSAILSAIDKAAQTWTAASDAARKLGEKVVEKLNEGAQKIVDALKPILEKIVELVESKMKAKESGGDDEKDEKEEEKDEKKAPAVGDVAKAWSFNATDIGKKLDSALDGKGKVSEAVGGAVDDVKNTLTNAVRKPLEKLADILTYGNAGNKWVAAQVRKVVDRITNLIIELTTLDGFMEASGVIANVVDQIEDLLSKAAGDKAKVTQAVDEGSALLWKRGLCAVGIALYSRIWKLQDGIDRVLGSQPDEVKQPLHELLDEIFVVQMRAFNGIRVQYIQNLREGVADAADANALKNAARAAFKGASFPVINLLGYHHWVKAHEKLLDATKAMILNAFDESVWPTVKEGLDALQSLIPDELAQMGLKLEPLVRNVIVFIINKAVEWIMKKVFMKVEELLFTQGYE